MLSSSTCLAVAKLRLLIVVRYEPVLLIVVIGGEMVLLLLMLLMMMIVVVAEVVMMMMIWLNRGLLMVRLDGQLVQLRRHLLVGAHISVR